MSFFYEYEFRYQHWCVSLHGHVYVYLCICECFCASMHNCICNCMSGLYTVYIPVHIVYEYVNLLVHSYVCMCACQVGQLCWWILNAFMLDSFCKDHIAGSGIKQFWNSKFDLAFSTGKYFLVPANLFLQKSPDHRIISLQGNCWWIFQRFWFILLEAASFA